MLNSPTPSETQPPVSVDWNQCYAKGETPWDKGEPTPVLEEVALRHPDLFSPSKQVLVPGCGIDHDARWLARQGCRAVGLDIAPLAIARARQFDVTQSVEFVEASLFELPSALRQRFDLVWEHTCLCALPPHLRQSYMDGVKEALRPRGMVAGVFFINPEMDPGEDGPPFGISVEELESLWKGAGFQVLHSWVPTTGYAGRINRERVLVLQKQGAGAVAAST